MALYVFVLYRIFRFFYSKSRPPHENSFLPETILKTFFPLFFFLFNDFCLSETKCKKRNCVERGNITSLLRGLRAFKGSFLFGKYHFLKKLDAGAMKWFFFSPSIISCFLNFSECFDILRFFGRNTPFKA